MNTMTPAEIRELHDAADRLEREARLSAGIGKYQADGVLRNVDQLRENERLARLIRKAANTLSPSTQPQS